VEKCEKPSVEELQRVQKLYIEELTRSVYPHESRTIRAVSHSAGNSRIWNTYKDKFAKARRRELNIID